MLSSRAARGLGLRPRSASFPAPIAELRELEELQDEEQELPAAVVLAAPAERSDPRELPA